MTITKGSKDRLKIISEEISVWWQEFVLNSEKSKTVFTGLTLTGVASPRLHILYEFLAVDSLDVRFRLMEVSD